MLSKIPLGSVGKDGGGALPRRKVSFGLPSPAGLSRVASTQRRNSEEGKELCQATMIPSSNIG